MKIIAKGARSRYPNFPFSYDKLRKIFEEVGIDHRMLSHGETPTDIFIRVLPSKNQPTEEQLHTLKNVLNKTFVEANFELMKSA
jgi:hypothetical protein